MPAASLVRVYIRRRANAITFPRIGIFGTTARVNISALWLLAGWENGLNNVVSVSRLSVKDDCDLSIIASHPVIVKIYIYLILRKFDMQLSLMLNLLLNIYIYYFIILDETICISFLSIRKMVQTVR